MNKRILIVEDEQITALDIKRMLEENGYSVLKICSSGKEAVERAKKNDPDLIICDIFLDDRMDGIETAKLIEEEQNIPIIFLSANTDITTIRRADTIKHYGYLIKPVTALQLKSVIDTSIELHRRGSPPPM